MRRKTKHQFKTEIHIGRFFFFISVVIGLLVGTFFQLYTATDSIIISEVCSNNQGILGQTSDYIELHNGGDLLCKLDALYLSDDEKDLKKYSLKGYQIEAKGYNVIWLDGVNEFALDEKGEYIYLSDDSGRILDTIKCPSLGRNLVYARIGEEWLIRRPSPGNRNDETSVLLANPSFSFESGFYEEEFQLEILTNTKTPVYYTLDGSEPDKTSFVYEEPIRVYDRSNEENIYRNIQNVVGNWENYHPDRTPVEKAFIVKAKAIDADGNYSDTITGTYFIGRDSTRDVISIVAEPDSLFGDDGIYVTGKAYDEWYLNSDRTEQEPVCNFWLKNEIPATFFFFNNEEKSCQQNIGLRIQGYGSRNSALKRFSFFAREEYDGSNRFSYPLLGARQGHSYFVRDSFSNMFLQSLAKDREVAVVDTRPVTVFLNGEYWYDMYLTERADAMYFADTYSVPKDDVLICKESMFDKEVDLYINDPYYQLVYFAEDNDLGDEENYAKISQMMDIQSYIDFSCINIYCANVDVGERKNCILWRAEKREFGGYSDGRWRWMLHDMDVLDWVNPLSYGADEVYKINTFTQETTIGEKPFNQTRLFKGLKANDDFCRRFVLTFMDLVNENFSIEKVAEELEKYGEDITWKDSFFLKRSEYIVPMLADEFDLKYELTDIYVSVNDASGGVVKVNTIEPDVTGGTWKGTYFGDYPLEVTAIPNPGYEFVSWKGDVLSETNSIEVDLSKGDMYVEAIFRESK